MDWKAYSSFVSANRVPVKHVKWYVWWAKRFIKVVGGDLSGVTPQQVNDFFRVLHGVEGRDAWQLEQAAASLRLLFTHLPGHSLVSCWEKEIFLPTVPNPVIYQGDAANQQDRSLFSELLDKQAAVAQPDILELVRNASRLRHYSRRTEQSYEGWIKRFLYNNPNRKVSRLGAGEVRSFLEYLAREKKVSASTQNQALNSLVFFFDRVLGKPLGEIGDFAHAHRPTRLPVVLSINEVKRLFFHLEGLHLLMAGMLYGSGLRLMECMRLRVMDVDFDRQELLVRDGKGKKDRVTILPERYQQILKNHLVQVKSIHERALSLGNGRVYLPEALARKYSGASKEWGWQYVFPASRSTVDPHSGQVWRHHLHESVLQRAIKQASGQAGIAKRVSSHVLRHSFATHMLDYVPLFRLTCWGHDWLGGASLVYVL